MESHFVSESLSPLGSAYSTRNQLAFCLYAFRQRRKCLSNFANITIAQVSILKNFRYLMAHNRKEANIDKYAFSFVCIFDVLFEDYIGHDGYQFIATMAVSYTHLRAHETG